LLANGVFEIKNTFKVSPEELVGQMTYLIDTQVLLWLLFSPEHISKKGFSIIKNTNQNLLVSQVSLWEIPLKYSIGKLKLIKYKQEDIIATTQEMNGSILEFTNEHLLKYCQRRKTIHKDPFDRFLIWQALSLDVPIISKDKSFNLYKPDGLNTIW